MGHSFGGKVALLYARDVAASLRDVWVLDSPPGVRPLDEGGVGYRNATAVPVPADGLITVLISDEDGSTVDCTFSFVIHRP